jgi:transcriptional regulator of PTS gene
LVVIVFQVVGRSIRAVTINLLGQMLRQEQEELPGGCENANMLRVLAAMRERIAARTPANTEIAGVSFALSGLVDPLTEEWIFNSRWPFIRRLRLRDSMGECEAPIFVTRNLDAELRARLALSPNLKGPTLLLHWGDGIGTAFGSDGQVAFGETRGFGEIGHWRLAGHDAACRCGRCGCLETVAALWSLSDEVMGSRYDPELDEEHVAYELRNKNLMSRPKLVAALDAMVLSLANLCRVLFPRQVIITGPFVENSALWDAFRNKFWQEGVMVGYETPDLILGERSDQMAIDGAVAPLLKRSLNRLLQTMTEEMTQIPAHQPVSAALIERP